MESQNLYQLLHQERTIGDPINKQLREADAPNFACPSDLPQELLVPESGMEGGWRDKREFRTGSYRANTGRVKGKETWYLAEEIGSGIYKGELQLGWRGPMHLVGYLDLTEESMRNIEDGTSNTLMVGEHTTSTNPNRRTFWAYTWGGYAMSQAWNDPRMFLGDYDKCQSLPPGPGSNRVCMAMWHSFHPGIINFLRCDGSVSPIQESIDLDVFGGLCSIAGNELVQEN